LGCAVVPIETAYGPEPYAVLAVRGTQSDAARAIENANARLAEFQRVNRWALWPEPDLPRTSTGKVRRKAVAAWVAESAARGGASGDASGITSGDWLYSLVAEIAGERPVGEDELRLSDDFHLDSLGRVQLAAALEERLGALDIGNALDEVKTLGELRTLLGGRERDQKNRDQGSQNGDQGSGIRDQIEL
jgi:long-chain acyl-CoA synthetase